MLQGFPMVSQLTPVTSDGKISENAGLDCVAASITAGVMYLKGVKAVNQDYNPDKFKDKAYGDAYHGGTSAQAYVPFCQSLGVLLYPLNGIPGQLVQYAHEQIAKGHPVVFTEPNPYGPQTYSHVCVFFADEPGWLTAMDPFIAKPIRRSDADWMNLLLDNQIWPMELIATPKPAVPSGIPAEIPEGWHDDGQELVAPNKIKVALGFRTFVLANHWDPANFPLGPEYGTPQLEESNPSLGGGDQQMFRWTMLGYTKDRGVFEEWVGCELQAARAHITKLYNTNQQLRALLQQSVMTK